MRILVVEDEPLLRDGLRDLLRGDGHEPEVAADGRRGLELAESRPFDLVVLDVMLPRLDGLSVLRALRAHKPGLPVLLLTARGSEDDVVRGLGEGADDYVVKPFGARELLARIGALARRAKAGALAEVLSTDGCELDLSRCVARRGPAEQTLTPREAAILRHLYAQRGRTVTRPELLERVWGASGEMQTRTVDVTVANLRKKIERDPSNPRVVISVKGLGYRWGAGP